jgi:hypothetical protein
MNNLTYTCSICHCVNHVARLHCQACGVVPAMYSVGQIQTVAAINCDRAEQHRNARVNLRTVPADYYASGE